MEREALAKPGLQRKMETVCVCVCGITQAVISLERLRTAWKTADKIVITGP